LSFDNDNIPRYHNKHDPEDVSSTFAAVKNSAEFLDWEKTAESKTLWIVGKPGCGKSTLSRHLLNIIKPKGGTSEMVVCSYFINGQAGSFERSEDGLLRSLLGQILNQRPKLIQRILEHPIYKEMKQDRRIVWNKANLRVMLKSAVGDSALRGLHIFIDAIDEFDPNSKDDLLEFLSELVKVPSKDANLKMFITSRPYPAISFDIAGGLSLQLEHMTSTDIAKFVHKELHKLMRKFPDTAEELVEVEAKINKRANGVFLWVRLVLERLGRAAGLGSKIEQAIDTFPQGLSPMYDHILQSTPDEERNELKQLLEWAALTQRVLTLSEFQYALALSSPDRVLSQATLQGSSTFLPLVRLERRISALSGGLMEVKSRTSDSDSESDSDFDFDSGSNSNGQVVKEAVMRPDMKIVQFIHQSVRDYLVGEAYMRSTVLPSTISELYRIQPKESQANLAAACIKYITFSDFDRNHELYSHQWSANSTTKLYTDYPFLDYAAHNWTEHASIAKDHEDMISSALELFKWPETKRLTAWLQVYLYADKMSTVKDLENVTLLHLSALVNAPTISRKLLKSGRVDVNRQCDAYGTALEIAAEKGHLDMVELLLNGGATIDSESSKWGNALEPATYGGNESVVKFLLDRGVDVNTKSGRHGSALLAAATANNLRMSQLLIDNGADIEVEGKDGKTPLCRAAYEGYYSLVRLLADNGADVNSVGKDGHRGTPLHSTINGHPSCRRPRQHRSSTKEWTETLLVLLEKGAIPDLAPTGYMSPLHVALCCTLYELPKALIENGADPNRRDHLGFTPLFTAADNWMVELVELLLQRGADPNVHVEGQTPLHLAAHGHGSGGWTFVEWVGDPDGSRAQVVELLLKNGASPNITDSERRTPLHWAADSGLAKAVEALLKYGADGDIPDKAGDLPLHRGARYADVVKALITCGKDVGINAPGASNAMGTNGGTPLIIAAFNGNLEGVQLLLQHKADIEATDGDGDKALAQAAWNGQAPVLKALLEAGATINSMSADGSTALHHAATNGHRICVQELLDGGADPNLVNRRGEKPLHLAVQGGFISIVKLLDKMMDIDGVPGESTEVSAAVKKARESSGDGEGESPQNRYESRNYKL